MMAGSGSLDRSSSRHCKAAEVDATQLLFRAMRFTRFRSKSGVSLGHV
jgi:hypothetical protein